MPDEPTLPGINSTPLPRRSLDRRRTVRRNALVAQGVNPGSMLPLADNGETCGTCAHHFVTHRGGRYHKCELTPGGWTRGAATDIRTSWPACVKWEADDG